MRLSKVENALIRSLRHRKLSATVGCGCGEKLRERGATHAAVEAAQQASPDHFDRGRQDGSALQPDAGDPACSLIRRRGQRSISVGCGLAPLITLRPTGRSGH